MSAAPASASKLAWRKSSSGLVVFGLSGFALFCASCMSRWLLVDRAESPLFTALGKLADGRTPLIVGLIRDISAARDRSLDSPAYGKFRTPADAVCRLTIGCAVG